MKSGSSDEQSRSGAGLRFLYNSFSWLASSIISRAVAALLFFLLTRTVSVEETGMYSLAVTFTALFMPLLGWGLEHLFIRNVSYDLAQSNRYLARYLSFRLLCAVVAYGLLLLLVGLIGYPEQTQIILALMGLTLFSEGINELFQSVFATIEQTHYMLYVFGSINVMRLIVGILILTSGGGAIGLTLVVIGTSFLKTAFFAVILIRKQILSLASGGFGRFRFDELVPHLRHTLPFMLIDVFWAIEYQSGVVLLSILLNDAAVGLYGVAMALLSIFMMVGHSYMMTIFPVMSRLYHRESGEVSDDGFDFVYEESIVYMLVVSLAMAATMTFYGKPILNLLFSDAFASSVELLIPLVWTLPFFFVHVPVSRVMILENAQKPLAINIGIGAGVNIVLTALLIRWIGTMGASIARLASYSLFFVLNYSYVNAKIYHKDLYSLAMRPILAFMIMCIVFYLCDPLDEFVGLTLGLASYFLALVALNVVSISKIQKFQKSFG